MDRNTIDSKLEEIETQLQTLSLQAAELRALRSQLDIKVGDIVSFRLDGTTERGVVIGLTPHRVRIRATRRSGVFLRAPHNVRVIRHV